MNVITLTKDPVQRAEAVAKINTLLSELSMSYTWQVAIKRQTQKRSPEQNAYYHAVPLRMIADQTGHDPEEIKEYLCGERFGWLQIMVFGKKRHRPAKTTSQLTSEEFARLIDWTQAWAMRELGMLIPGPNEHIT